MSIRLVKPFAKPLRKRLFSSNKSDTASIIGSMFVVGGLYTSIIVSELNRENLYMKRYHEEVIERLKRIEK